MLGMQLKPIRHIVLILGDQLDEDSSAFDGFDAAQDLVLMVEAMEESTHVWSHKTRTALFLSAMRHFAQRLLQRGWQVDYRALDVEGDTTLAEGLLAAIETHRPQAVIGVEPGDLRVRDNINSAIKSIAGGAIPACAAGPKGLKNLKITMAWREDRHFLCTRAQFRAWAKESESLRMEFFYRQMRRKYRVLMDGDAPVGGQWNYDADNRKGFGRAGPKAIPRAPVFEPDAITRGVMAMVGEKFADHPGDLGSFNWPVTRAEALSALDDFIEHRLPAFGAHQDAMWTHMPFGWHALLSSALNLKLLTPLEVILAAETAWRERGLDLASVEGFIRQILGWREFMRGVYFLDMPGLKAANHFGHQRNLPAWYWSGNTRMNCMRQCIGQTLDTGYAHHIQRLMVTGMFGIIAELVPQQLCDWYLAVYVDAVEWVELPNTAGMALFADGGRFTSKPYIASGAYIKRMSNYCKDCVYEPERRAGPAACPVTTLYWNFLDGHEAEFGNNPRTSMMVKNLQRLSAEERKAIRERAGEMLIDLDGL
jgi:deoxyribodipyrimidine photolyase-related protein